MTAIASAGGVLRVTITNQGEAAVTDAFWVDVYLGPRSTPTGVNQIWDSLGEHGLAWLITGGDLPLAPGASLILSIGDARYRADYSAIGGVIAAGTLIYAQVDSWNGTAPYGAVLEAHERDGGAYNNIAGSVAASDMIPPADLTEASWMNPHLPRQRGRVLMP